ncbi:hypothetical protein LWI28_007824 [Acer negundo]|uniref:Uncharacterized protein n=1 Tax=Acer negundo TaxID=4023 RepID=A0AAD5NRL1_ACENE|nr:hypothetical protein LWI28_007824 [Acer negundo]
MSFTLNHQIFLLDFDFDGGAADTVNVSINEIAQSDKIPKGLDHPPKSFPIPNVAVAKDAVIVSQANTTILGQNISIPSRVTPAAANLSVPCTLSKEALKFALADKRWREVTEGTSRRSLASTKNRASVASESPKELVSKSGSLEVELAKAELRCIRMEQMALSAEQKARIAKETLATVQHSMLES